MTEERASRTRSATRERAPAKRVVGAEDAVRRATGSLSELIGRDPDGCSEVSPTDDRGWLVCVDVVEVARIPDTTSVMATYEVELGEDGSLLRYRRARRYRRGAADT